MDNIASSVSKIIYWIEHDGTSFVKEYNNLKQRLMKIRMKNLAHIRLFDYNIRLKVLEKNCSNYDIFINNIIRYNVVLFINM